MSAAMAAGDLDDKFFVAADDAYSACSEQLVTPYYGRNLEPDRDSFNYHLSNMRVSWLCISCSPCAHR